VESEKAAEESNLRPPLCNHLQTTELPQMGYVVQYGLPVLLLVDCCRSVIPVAVAVAVAVVVAVAVFRSNA
jgi:hypothetical protein